MQGYVRISRKNNCGITIDAQYVEVGGKTSIITAQVIAILLTLLNIWTILVIIHYQLCNFKCKIIFDILDKFKISIVGDRKREFCGKEVEELKKNVTNNQLENITLTYKCCNDESKPCLFL